MGWCSAPHSQRRWRVQPGRQRCPSGPRWATRSRWLRSTAWSQWSPSPSPPSALSPSLSSRPSAPPRSLSAVRCRVGAARALRSRGPRSLLCRRGPARPKDGSPQPAAARRGRCSWAAPRPPGSRSAQRSGRRLSAHSPQPAPRCVVRCPRGLRSPPRLRRASHSRSPGSCSPPVAHPPGPRGCSRRVGWCVAGVARSRRPSA